MRRRLSNTCLFIALVGPFFAGEGSFATLALVGVASLVFGLVAVALDPSHVRHLQGETADA